MALDGFPSPLIVAREQHGVACGTARRTNPPSVALSWDGEEVVCQFVFLPRVAWEGGPHRRWGLIRLSFEAL